MISQKAVKSTKWEHCRKKTVVKLIILEISIVVDDTLTSYHSGPGFDPRPNPMWERLKLLVTD